LTAAAMALMSAMSWSSRVTLRPLAPAAVPASSRALITAPKTANPARSMLAAWELTSDVTASMVDLIRLYLLKHGQDARIDELCHRHRVARCDGQGMLHASN
jgi:hypothetical protein